MSGQEEPIGATHEFHRDEYARSWADRFQVTKERGACFQHLGDLLQPWTGSKDVILELGIGPGYLARYLLSRFPHIHYHGLDFSKAMLKIARENLEGFSSRLTLQEMDLTRPDWDEGVKGPFSAIVSTWALHDLGSLEAIRSVYRSASRLLVDGGVLLNADFIRPAGLDRDYEPGRILISEHLDLLKLEGFSEVACTGRFEVDLVNPASHNNYACLSGRVYRQAQT